MIATLAEHPDGYALVIDKHTLDSLQASPGTSFEVISDGRSLVVTPVRDAEQDQQFDQAVERVHARFGNAMKKLAE